MLQYIHTAYMTKPCLATLSPDTGTCLNTRLMIWISVIHAEINRPDELFGNLLPPHWVGFSPPPKCLNSPRFRLKIPWKEKKGQKSLDLSSLFEANRYHETLISYQSKSKPFQSLNTLQETFNLLSVCLVIIISLCDVASWNLPEYHGPKYLSYEAIQWKA